MGHHHHTTPQQLLDAKLKRQQQHSEQLAERQRRIEAKTRQKREIEAAAQAVKDQEAAARAAEVEKAKNQLIEWKRLTDEYNQRIDEKVASGEIPPLNEYQREKLQYEYVAANTSDPQIKEVMGSMSTSVDTRAKYDAEAAARHLRHLQQHKHNPSFASQCFNVFKIVAIGAVAVFAPPLVGTVAPMLASLGTAGTFVGTGIACAGTDAICQKIGVTTGLQKSFSINEVLETGVSVGLGSAAASAGMLPAAMTSASGGAITQAVEVQMGTRDDLDPLAVATQGASSIVSSVVSQVITPTVNGALQENLPDAVKKVGEENIALATNGIAQATANSAVQSIALNAPMNLGSVLVNALGSTLGAKVGSVINDALYKLNPTSPLSESDTTETTSTDSTEDSAPIGDMCVIDETANVQLPTEQEMQEFLEMVKQTIERMSIDQVVTSDINETSTTNPEAQPGVSDDIGSYVSSSDDIEVIPPVIVNTSESPPHEESFYDSLSDWQKAGLPIGIVLGVVALLPEEIGAALLFGLGRLGMALIPEVGVLPEALAVDAMAGEAIAGTAAGAAAGNFFSKMMSKVGLFKSEMASAITADSKIISQESEFYPKAKLISEHNFYNPGMAERVRDTFMGCAYNSYRLEEDVILYRAGSKEFELGEYFSFEKPVSELQVRIDKALRHIWDEPAGTSVIESGYTVKIPKGTIVHVGEIAPQKEIFLGGTKQIFIETPWKITDLHVIEKFPLKEELLWNQIARASQR